jgi:adenylate cyclase
MDLKRFSDLLVQSVGVGMAAVDEASHNIIFLNSRMRDWLPTSEDAKTLDDLFPEFEAAAAAEKLADQKPYTFDAEVGTGRRRISVAVEVTRHVGDEAPVLVVECQNVSKIRELEYMIESYASMIERQNRDLKKEKKRVENVLLNIMPKTVYEEWRQFGVTTPQRYDSASILMLDCRLQRKGVGRRSARAHRRTQRHLHVP